MLPERDERRGVYVISVAAGIVHVHPRTLRIYEAEGLLRPARRNNLRLYSEADIARIRLIRRLVGEVGLNLAGVRLLLALEAAGELRLDAVGRLLDGGPAERDAEGSPEQGG